MLQIAGFFWLSGFDFGLVNELGGLEQQIVRPGEQSVTGFSR